MTDEELEQHKEGIKRADRWLYFGMTIALINVLLAGYVWMVKP